MEQTFETPEPVDLYVENGRGRVVVTTADVARTEVRVSGPQAAEFVVEHRGDGVAVVAPRGSGFLRKDSEAEVEVVAPRCSGLTAKLGSSDLVTHGALGTTWVNSGSGDVALERVDGTLDVQSGSGGVRVGHVELEGRIKSGSGDVRVESHRGTLAVKSGSGDVLVGQSGDELACTTGSGDVEVRVAGRGRVTARSASGDIGIGFTPGTPVWTDVNTVSGRISSTLPPTGEPAEGQDFVELRATTVSGDVTLSLGQPQDRIATPRRQ